MGIPLLILFYNPDQPEVKELFKARVAEELKEHRGTCEACLSVPYLATVHVWGQRCIQDIVN